MLIYMVFIINLINQRNLHFNNGNSLNMNWKPISLYKSFLELLDYQIREIIGNQIQNLDLQREQTMEEEDLENLLLRKWIDILIW